MKKYDLSLVIPAYNEEKKIKKDIVEAFRYFKKAKIKAEVIVSTDGVTDRTNDIVKDLTKKYKDLQLIAIAGKVGKGGALKRGFNRASGKYLMFADAGLCVPYKFVKDGLELLDQGFDCALASRADFRSKILKSQPLYRKIGSKIFGLMVRFLLGVPSQIKDTQCGFKLYQAGVAKKIYAKSRIKRMMFDIEVILIAKKMGYSMMQFPVEWTNDPDTKLKPLSGGIGILKELLTIKFIYQL